MSIMDSLSVVIPTYNREALLKKALEGYLTQSAAQSICEVIVVDDGSTDSTESVVLEIGQKSPFPVRYLRQPNKGPAAARNVGIRDARADIILFTDDDIIPHPDLVMQHLAFHEEHSESCYAVQGYVTWSPQVSVTPFMKWYGEQGALFGFSQIKGRTEIDFRYFYSCNVSLKSAFLRDNGMFDESFRGAAYEDPELGYRLERNGMRLLYNPAAVGYHFQSFSFEQACQRGKRAAAGRSVFLQREAGAYAVRRDALLRWRGARWLTRRLVRLASPLKALLDSRVPFPSVFYRAFYWYYSNPQE